MTGDEIPARQDVVRSFDFASSVQDWFGPVGWDAGRLKAAVTSTIQGPAWSLISGGLSPIPVGRAFTVEFDIELPPGMTVRCSALKDGLWAATNGAGANGFNVAASGHYKATLYTDTPELRMPEQLCFLSYVMPGAGAYEFWVDNVVFTLLPSGYAVTVPAKNSNVLYDGGLYTGTMGGVLARVHGVLSTDASGNWTFTRDSQGGAVACLPGTRLYPDEASTFRLYTNILWAGNNGVASTGDASATKGDIAAMVANLQHPPYLVVSVLTSSNHDAGRIAVLQQLNADLKAVYGPRFVDVYGALRAAGDGSANDNADIAAGYTPRSLRMDNIHLNSADYAVVAAVMREKLAAFGG